ncbi:MAG: hypothetical protein WA324_11340 [Bryobacteraceae bacterium]
MAKTLATGAETGRAVEKIGEEPFTGKVRDLENGLDWFNARYYGAALGGFLSPNPGMRERI